MKKLNIGCGTNIMEGYINIDFVEPYFVREINDDSLRTKDSPETSFEQVNITEIERYFAANSVDEVFASHLFEHLTHYEITTLLFKIWTILKPGGKLIIITPEFFNLLSEYKRKHMSKDFTDVDILHLKVFSTEAETLHKSVWTVEIGRFYLTRENLFSIQHIGAPSLIEVSFESIKI